MPDDAFFKNVLDHSAYNLKCRSDIIMKPSAEILFIVSIIEE